MNRWHSARPILAVGLTAALLLPTPMFAGSKQGQPAPSGADGRGVTVVVGATVETNPVPHAGDAADDPAIWVHPTDPSLSTIIGTDKDGGLAVYDLSGKQLQYVADGRFNNVDLRDDFPLGGQGAAVVAATRASDNSIAVYRVDPTTRHLEKVAARPIRSEARARGLCMYRSRTTGKYYVFGTGGKGAVEQWELFDDGHGRVDGRRVRTLSVGSQSEGCVADDELGHLYLAEETVGIWKFGAEPDAGKTRTQMDSTRVGGHLTADVEGLAIYSASRGTGYLIASNQGSNTFVVYRREANNAYVLTFAIGARNGIDAVENTDGIDVTSTSLGRAFPQGLFVAQDGRNDGSNQNFKLVRWDAIASAGSLPLATGQALTGPTGRAGLRTWTTSLVAALAPIAAAQGAPPTFGDLKVGQGVKAEGKSAGARTILAREIQMQPGPEPDKLKGRIDAIGDNSVTVLGVNLIAPPGARIMDRDGRDIPLSALRKGWAVKAKGQLREDGSLQATEINVLPGLSTDEAEVRGRIQALDPARQRFTVMGLTIHVTHATQIVFE